MTEQYNGYTVTLAYDQEADDPLTWATPEGRRTWFALRHKRYSLPFEIDADPDDYHSWTELAAAYSRTHGDMPYKFVRWYEHSGIAVSLQADDGGRDWDAGIAGVIFGNTIASIKASFAVWQAYVAADVYTLTITAPDGTEVDSLCGLYGYDEALGCARWVIDVDAKLTGVARIRRYGRVHAPRAQEMHV